MLQVQYYWHNWSWEDHLSRYYCLEANAALVNFANLHASQEHHIYIGLILQRSYDDHWCLSCKSRVTCHIITVSEICPHLGIDSSHNISEYLPATCDYSPLGHVTDPDIHVPGAVRELSQQSLEFKKLTYGHLAARNQLSSEVTHSGHHFRKTDEFWRTCAQKADSHFLAGTSMASELDLNIRGSGIEGSHAFWKLPYWTESIRPPDPMHTLANEVGAFSTSFWINCISWLAVAIAIPRHSKRRSADSLQAFIKKIFVCIVWDSEFWDKQAWPLCLQLVILKTIWLQLTSVLLATTITAQICKCDTVAELNRPACAGQKAFSLCPGRQIQ